MIPALEVKGVSKVFSSKSGLFGALGKRLVHAVDDVSFSVRPGTTLCLVGESGCGKTTIGRIAVRLTQPTTGHVLVHGEDFTSLSGEALRRKRKAVQMVFQDPFACLNPRMTGREIVAEPLENFGLLAGQERQRRVNELFDRVGLPTALLDRLPHQISGGQRQRLGIARALAAEPEIVVADEAVAALDVSIRSQILNLLNDVRRDSGIASLFISHDLSVVRYLADDVAVMYLGAVVEMGPADAVFAHPRHPYTRALMASIPASHPRNRHRTPALEGEVPSATALPSGCRFRTRCPRATEICARVRPPLTKSEDGHEVACHHPVPDATTSQTPAGQLSPPNDHNQGGIRS